MKAAAGRVAQLLVVLFLVSLGTFSLTALMPGDPAVAILGENQPPQAYAAVREQLGLNEPLVRRFFSWLGDVLSGHLGDSMVAPYQDVGTLLGRAFLVSLELAVLALALALLVSIP